MNEAAGRNRPIAVPNIAPSGRHQAARDSAKMAFRPGIRRGGRALAGQKIEDIAMFWYSATGK
jgi:hypothetical protein